MRVLLVDDHLDALDALAGFVEQLGHQVRRAGDGRQALDAVRSQRPDLVLSDLRMPVLDGLGLLAALEEFDAPPPFALMTAFSDAQTAVDAMRLGAIDYLRKPVDVRELHRLLDRVELASGPPPAPDPIRDPAPGVDGLVIAGPATAAVVALADRLHQAPQLSCLIEAETGCGKELIAKRIHHGGREAERSPFIAVNCAAIPAGLFEAELFGYVPGAFTGAATGGSTGRLAQAGEGTVFLDEIGELPLDQQAKLLRVLEDRSWYPVGGSKLMQLRARIICASNRSLFQAAREGRFREDLLYRLKVGFIRIPPLRERREEIAPLARSILASIRATHVSGFRDLADGCAAILRQASWPGNIRQLHHVLERLSVMSGDGGLLTATLLTQAMSEEEGSGQRPAVGHRLTLGCTPPADVRLPPESFDLEAWNRALIAAALRLCDGSPVRTAQYLGISRKVLYTLRKHYGLMQAADE
jgi:two-component system response regulator AtoC